ncbi:Signal transduction histidine kinase [Lachnospiraceae bacterium XBB1006]|nr:Signal transduction histidine kinase [Lachnospiraceae bacterium XBB1006]
MRQELVDKGIIWLSGMVLTGVLGAGEGLVLSSLCAIVITLIPNLKYRIPYLQEILIAVYIIAGFQWWACLPFMPLIMYDVMKKRHYEFIILGMIVLVTQFIGTGDSLRTQISMYVVVLSIISWRMALQTGLCRDMEERMRKLRDDSVESSILLKERNRTLLEQQNAEIHMATLKERNRIAREIHDHVGHMLTRAILQTGALKVVEKDNALKEQLEGLQETLNMAMDNIRQSVHDLHDESIDLERGVKELIAAFPTLEIKFSYAVDKSVDNEMKYGFLAIIKEALNNTVKHSNGNQVTLKILENPGFYSLFIADNGTDIPKDFTGGMGLAGIRERVDNLHGFLRISTENGFQITITILK